MNWRTRRSPSGHLLHLLLQRRGSRLDRECLPQTGPLLLRGREGPPRGERAQQQAQFASLSELVKLSVALNTKLFKNLGHNFT